MDERRERTEIESRRAFVMDGAGAGLTCHTAPVRARREDDACPRLLANFETRRDGDAREAGRTRTRD